MNILVLPSWMNRMALLMAAALLLVPVTAQAAPDLSVVKTCVTGSAQSVLCTVTITNIGDVPSVSPISLTDTVTGSTTVNYTGAGGSLPASCTPGAQVINNVPISCPAINTSLAPAASGDVLFSFTMPQGGTFTNCVSVSQGQNPGTPGDPNAANNTNICTTLTVSPPAPATGTITIVKDAQPNDAQDFAFTSNQATIAPFPLDDDSDGTLSNQRVFANLGVGSYTFTETQVSGWTLASIVCTPASGTSANLGTGTASITLAAGDNITCTFINTKAASGTLTIVKEAQPGSDPQDFHFSTVGTGLSDFDLDDDGTAANPLSSSKTFSNLAAGIPFTVTEAAVSGWTVPSIQCLVAVPGLTTTFTDQLNRTFTVNLEAGANVTCTFINVKTAPVTGQICGVKFNDLDGDGVQDAGDLGLPNWQIGLNIATTPPVLTGIKGEYCFSGLPAGTYTIAETPQAPWQQTFPSSPGTHTVVLAAGQNLNGINFGNTIPGGLCSALSGSSFSLLVNGSFENEQLVSAGNFNFFDDALISGWDTTASNGLMEVRGTGHGGVTAYSGNQFIELNTTLGTTVYQPFTATPGSTITLTFAHRGRAGFPNQMNVAITPVSGVPVALGTFTGSTAAWTLNSVSYTFPTNGVTAYELSFTSGDTSAGGNFLDVIDVIDMACATAVVDTGMVLSDEHVFAFVEDSYPLTFSGNFTAGQYLQYKFRYYPATSNYLAIDGAGMIFMRGALTDNAISPFGEVEELRELIAAWDLGPLTDARVFDFAEANYPGLFKGTATNGQDEQYRYRLYAETATYLMIDNAGMISLLGPGTGNVTRTIGPVESFRARIVAWESGL